MSTFTNLQRNGLALAIVLGAVVFSVSPAIAIDSFFDVFVDVGDAAIDFGSTDLPPLPADFFEPGSPPFDAVVPMQGNPPGDTIVGRVNLFGDPDFPPYYDGLVDIEIVALSLTSVAPIDIDGLSFDVFAEITKQPEHNGHVTVLKASDPGPDDGEGFVVDSFFDVFYEIEFVPQGDLRGGDSTLTISNIGSSGLDGVMQNPPGTVRWDRATPDGHGVVIIDPISYATTGGGISFTMTPVPEPTSLAILAGATVLAMRRRI